MKTVCIFQLYQFIDLRYIVGSPDTHIHTSSTAARKSDMHAVACYTKQENALPIVGS